MKQLIQDNVFPIFGLMLGIFNLTGGFLNFVFTGSSYLENNGVARYLRLLYGSVFFGVITGFIMVFFTQNMGYFIDSAMISIFACVSLELLRINIEHN